MRDEPAFRNDPLLPNAAIVARREYRDRVRSPFFVASTILLMALALGVGLDPIAIRYLDRQSVTRIAVVAADQELGIRAIAVTDSLLNVPPGAVDAAAWEKPFLVELATDLAAADAALAKGDLGGIMIVARQPSGQLDITFRTKGPADGVRSQLVGFAAIAVGILDWTATLPPDAQLERFQTPLYRTESTSACKSTDSSRADPSPGCIALRTKIAAPGIRT